MAIRLVLVRHGLSSFNAKGLIQGRTDDSVLTDEGYEQARKAGKALSKINFDKIYSSPLLRAAETAKTIKNTFNKDQNIIFGIRPEDISVNLDKKSKMKDSIELDAEISVIEPMGHETVVICDSNYGELTGKVESSHTLKENMKVKLIIKEEKIYQFDKMSEKNLLL